MKWEHVYKDHEDEFYFDNLGNLLVSDPYGTKILVEAKDIPKFNDWLTFQIKTRSANGADRSL